MTSFWFFLGDCYEIMFGLMRHIGTVLNVFLIAVGFIGAFYWIGYMLKNPRGKDNYLAEH